MSAVPFTFAHRSGNILLDELDVNFANVKAFANSAGVVTNPIQSSITGVGTLTSLTVSGSTIANTVSANSVSVTGNLISNGNVAVVSSVNRNIYVSTLAPTSGDGNDGDIWFRTV